MSRTPTRACRADTGRNATCSPGTRQPGGVSGCRPTWHAPASRCSRCSSRSRSLPNDPPRDAASSRRGARSILLGARSSCPRSARSRRSSSLRRRSSRRGSWAIQPSSHPGTDPGLREPDRVRADLHPRDPGGRAPHVALRHADAHLRRTDHHRSGHRSRPVCRGAGHRSLVCDEAGSRVQRPVHASDAGRALSVRRLPAHSTADRASVWNLQPDHASRRPDRRRAHASVKE